MLNKMGPKIEPCGTPEIILFHELNLEFFPSFFSSIISRQCWVHIGTSLKISSKNAESWLQMMRSNILEMTGNTFTGL